MPRTYTISKEEANKNKKIRKTITDKRVDKRLRAVQLRGEGLKNSEIAEKLETSTKVVSRWVCAYKNKGIEALYQKKRIGNNHNISFEEEEKLLSNFFELAEKGQMIEVSKIKTAYVEKVRHEIGRGQIYRVLKRHGWQKVMPKNRHPKKASNEEINSSKKLTQL